MQPNSVICYTYYRFSTPNQIKGVNRRGIMTH